MRLQKKHGCANMDKALDRYIIHAVWKRKKMTVSYRRQLVPAGFVMTRLVKRETGVIPVRSRHCDKGVQILFPHGKPLVHGTGKAESV